MTADLTPARCGSTAVHPPHPIDGAAPGVPDCDGRQRRATDTEIAQARAYAEHAVGPKPDDDGDWGPPSQAQVDEWERNVQHEYEGALEVLIHANGGRYSEPADRTTDEVVMSAFAEFMHQEGAAMRPGDFAAYLRHEWAPEIGAVGRCGAGVPRLIDGQIGAVCALPAGHAGWHRSDGGTEWGMPAETDRLVTAVLDAAIVVAADLRTAPFEVPVNENERRLIVVVDAMLAARSSDETGLLNRSGSPLPAEQGADGAPDTLDGPGGSEGRRAEVIYPAAVPTLCPARYERPGGREPGDRIVRCHLQAGHTGEHEEAGTEVTWEPDQPVAPVRPLETLLERGESACPEHRAVWPDCAALHEATAERVNERLTRLGLPPLGPPVTPAVDLADEAAHEHERVARAIVARRAFVNGRDVEDDWADPATRAEAYKLARTYIDAYRAGPPNRSEAIDAIGHLTTALHNRGLLDDTQHATAARVVAVAIEELTAQAAALDEYRTQTTDPNAGDWQTLVHGLYRHGVHIGSLEGDTPADVVREALAHIDRLTTALDDAARDQLDDLEPDGGYTAAQEARADALNAGSRLGIRPEGIEPAAEAAAARAVLAVAQLYEAYIRDGDVPDDGPLIDEAWEATNGQRRYCEGYAEAIRRLRLAGHRESEMLATLLESAAPDPDDPWAGAAPTTRPVLDGDGAPNTDGDHA